MEKTDDITTLDVRQFLPQQPPFVLIDKLLEYDAETTAVKTALKVKADTPFVENGAMVAAGLVEHIAQSCAARVGYYDWLHDIPVTIGVIGEVKQMKIYYSPRVGDEIFTVVTPKTEVMGVLLASAVVKDAMQNLIAMCNIKTK